MNRLDWKWIGILSLAGPVIGLVSASGLPSEATEKMLWLPAVLVSAWVIARFAGGSPFANGAMAGFIAGAGSKLIQGILATAYWDANPWLAVALADEPNLHFQGYVLNLVPYVGLANALIQGFLALIASRIFARHT